MPTPKAKPAPAPAPVPQSIRVTSHKTESQSMRRVTHDTAFHERLSIGLVFIPQSVSIHWRMDGRTYALHLGRGEAEALHERLVEAIDHWAMDDAKELGKGGER